MKNYIMVGCEGCKTSFKKEVRFINATNKRNGKHYCSRKCFGKHQTGNLSISSDVRSWNKSEENKQHLRSICKNKEDEFTPFRILLSSCKKRNKECNLDLDYLKQLWEQQNGFCSITNVQLSLKQSYNKNYQASIDRIDNSIGYVKGNVRYTSVSVNWLRNNLDDTHLAEFIEICKLMVSK